MGSEFSKTETLHPENQREGTLHQNRVNFFMNGKSYNVNPREDNIGPEDRLVDFIRDKAGLKGTKYMCREGGCGACVVGIRSVNPTREAVQVVNSCLVPVLSCDGWDILTVEEVGSKATGYHEIQKRLVTHSGTQCGFCSSGMVMTMFSLAESKPNLKMKQIENSFDGNICRCTGYRPILDAFKSLASDAPPGLQNNCGEIEDIAQNLCQGECDYVRIPRMRNILLSDSEGNRWAKVTSLDMAFEAIAQFKAAGLKFKIVAGNTGTGVFKNDSGLYKAFVDIEAIEQLKNVDTGQDTLIIGSGVTLTMAIKAFKTAGNLTGFEYASGLSKHMERVANMPVRNMGTVGGNLMLKRNHRSFPSDLVTIFDAVGAKVSIVSSTEAVQMYSLSNYLTLDMDEKIIVAIHFKAYSKQYIFKSFKVTRRYQNAHAYVNAGFLVNVDAKDNFRVLTRPRIVYGGISNDFMHAGNTELFLIGRSLKNPGDLKGALDRLAAEVRPATGNGTEGSVEFRRLLALSLFYKFILGVLGDEVSAEMRSGAKSIKRKLTSGKQTYQTDETEWPVNQPVAKLESLAQVSGAAEYINDISPLFGELHGAFVLSTLANADIVGIDPSEAYKIPGVIRFIKADDIPGENSYTTLLQKPEEIFASRKIVYAGQSIGLIVAETQHAAHLASKLVKVEYGNIADPVLTIQETFENLQFSEGRNSNLLRSQVDGFIQESDATRLIQGEFAMGGQYHFHMETQIAICQPKEDGIDVYSATQWMDLVQASVASALNIPNNEVNIQVRRLGGAFGSKISRSSLVATACAVAAKALNRPVRVALDLETNMEMIGHRTPYHFQYQAQVGDNGKIASMTAHITSNSGASDNEEVANNVTFIFPSIYESTGWQLTPVNLITNIAPCTWTRAPGSTQMVACVEYMMEHIASQLSLDPLQVRMANLTTTSGESQKVTSMIDEMKASANVLQRQEAIAAFNKVNRWRKKGLSIVPLKYPLLYDGATKSPAYIAVYKSDGSVVVCHGGIECGQGINTKVAQVAAFELGISIDKIRIRPTNNLTAANGDATGGSVTSELCCFAVQQACKELKKRMAPIKEKYKPKTWERLVSLCYQNNILLTASFMPKPEDVKSYDIFVVNATEVEIDVLTGEYKIVRVDIIEDAGVSLNPLVDVGQVEGALMMGIGYWTTENLIYDKSTGRLLTNNTWTYKPPLPKDIPEDLRVTLLKNVPNPLGVLRSKATGEPPLCSGVAVLFALKQAIYAARKDAGHSEWFRLDGPVTVEDILMNSLITAEQLHL